MDIRQRGCNSKKLRSQRISTKAPRTPEEHREVLKGTYQWGKKK
jgi:hypothetical protein